MIEESIDDVVDPAAKAPSDINGSDDTGEAHGHATGDAGHGDGNKEKARDSIDSLSDHYICVDRMPWDKQAENEEWESTSDGSEDGREDAGRQDPGDDSKESQLKMFKKPAADYPGWQ
ncbi:hypothetical protein B0A48_04012 [Cryoendolithus antarcticus]|uniref:Uncharacterized protein n=1 Tax=Cryoendolithus antarcticus TaxID=1507870 RepID=A0A1V8THK6_9PEZI|nr:hypothetical protein B0A48_04012 [Cryoendolithus antarcticus]